MVGVWQVDVGETRPNEVRRQRKHLVEVRRVPARTLARHAVGCDGGVMQGSNLNPSPPEPSHLTANRYIYNRRLRVLVLGRNRLWSLC